MRQATVTAHAIRVGEETKRVLAAARSGQDELAAVTESLSWLDARLISGVLANQLVKQERESASPAGES